MDIRNCLHMPHYNINDFDQDKIKQLKAHTDFYKDIIIDYNDWTDYRNVPKNILKNIHYYFKRSIVDKNNNILIKCPDREIIPILYGIRSDFIEYDSNYTFKEYKYDVCCLFNPITHPTGGFRDKIPYVVNKYDGPKFVGRIDNKYNYEKVNVDYYNILKTSKIIVTANPPNWEGDFRLWEALLMGNLVLCDTMISLSIIEHPLVNKKHVVFYKNTEHLYELIQYYIEHDQDRIKIGNEGRQYCLKYHKFSDRVKQVLETLKV